jgi:3-oxoacyl-[acyl-carrier-protein] synthase III
MIIENVAVSLPERAVSNEEMIELIAFHSKSYNGDLPQTLRVVKARLDRSGLINRYWLADGERPIDHVFQAVAHALKNSTLRPPDIDLFIYVGIGGGFHKLGNAYILAKTLGFDNAECFDILDACMSWTRALYLVNSLFKTRGTRNALIVNGEFNVIAGAASYPGNCVVRDAQELEYLLPSFTVGEAATATLLLPGNADNLSITFRSKPDCADLCLIADEGHEGFFPVSPTVARLGAGRFTALGREIHEHIAEEVPLTMLESGISPMDADVVFTHASSKTAWNRIGMQHGFAEKIFHIYPETGNVGSASIPAAMALAQKAGTLVKGNRVAFLMGSAGMSFAAGKFVY